MKGGASAMPKERFADCRWLVSILAILSLVAVPCSSSAQVFGAVERAAARSAARSAVRGAERRSVVRAVRQDLRISPCRAIPQKCAGLLREDSARRILAGRYPNERIQAETYLLNRDGTRALDPLTGKARRIDFVMFSHGRVSRRFEITSQFADKRGQLAMEWRILSRTRSGRPRSGPAYVLDRQTGKLVPVSSDVSQVMRFH